MASSVATTLRRVCAVPGSGALNDNVFSQAAQDSCAGDNDTVMKSLVELCEEAPKVVRPHVEFLLNVCLQVSILIIKPLRSSTLIYASLMVEIIYYLQLYGLGQSLAYRKTLLRTSGLVVPYFS